MSAHRNAPLYGLLKTAYTEHQEIMAMLDTVDRERRQLRKRIDSGEVWMRRHNPQHPRYERNRKLLLKLQWQLDLNIRHTRDLKVARMGRALSIWSAYDAMSEAEQAAAKAEMRIGAIFRPDPERYQQLMENWQEYGPLVDVPYK